MSDPLLSLQLLDPTPVWIDQWPLPTEKLTALKSLIQEQLALGRLEPSNSPYNTPVFVIKKKSGRWRFLQDLRAVNKVIRPMGSLQCGLPNPNLLPRNYKLAVIDFKDAFFSIPLSQTDRLLFAFTLPVINHSHPTSRFQWKVLPQGMLNSATMCQYVVHALLEPFRLAHPDVLLFHYMDDILLAADVPLPSFQQTLHLLIEHLTLHGMTIAPEKVQQTEPFLYLGHKIFASRSSPVVPSLALPSSVTLVQLQQYLGSLNWARPYMGFTTSQLAPLFSALAGASSPSDIIHLSPEQLDTLTQVNNALRTKWVDRCQENVPLSLLLLNTPSIPTACLVQVLPSSLLIIEWIHLPHTPRKTISSRFSLFSLLLTRGRRRCLTIIGFEPVSIYVPFPLPTWENLYSQSLDFQMALIDWPGQVLYHFPRDPRIQLLHLVPVRFDTCLRSRPIPQALTVFADGTKTRGACAFQMNGQWVIHHTPAQPSAQRAELAASILAFQKLPTKPFNLIVDSLYVSQIIANIFDAYLSPAIDAPLMALFLTLQQLVMSRDVPFFVAHIRSHQPFPGMLTEGNDIADQAARLPAALSLSSPSPWESHSYFHQNAKALIKQFGISKTEASAIIQQCPTCSQHANSVPMGVNPRGLEASQIWQMDVTQHPPFAPWKHLHVSVDTHSGFIMASPQRGEATKHVINHCIRTFAVMGRPKELKTDNGPAYVSSVFAQFCNTWGIVHKFGIPYNSQGQAIVERAHLTIKRALEKIEKEKFPPGLPSLQNQLNRVLFTLNFLNITGSSPPTTAAQRHFAACDSLPPRPPVYYRLLPDLTWRGPADLITWGRGYAAIQLDDRVLWVPGRHVRPYLPRSSKAQDAASSPGDPPADASASLCDE